MRAVFNHYVRNEYIRTSICVWVTWPIFHADAYTCVLILQTHICVYLSSYCSPSDIFRQSLFWEISQNIYLYIHMIWNICILDNIALIQRPFACVSMAIHICIPSFLWYSSSIQHSHQITFILWYFFFALLFQEKPIFYLHSQ